MKDYQTLYQHGTLAQLVPGLFQGTQSVADLLTHGDTGIGTLTGLDGELIILNHEVYQFAATGEIRTVEANEQVPFANVHFLADQSAGNLAQLNFDMFKRAVIQKMNTTNLFYSVRVVGKFKSIHTRAVLPQEKPYPTLTETAAKQREYQKEDVSGTLIGYFSPDLYAGAVSPGFHLHFLSDDHSIGGHVLDLELNEGELFLQQFSNFNLHLPTDDQEFLKQTFKSDEIIDSIMRAEN
ncbi:acetolactate decarboxylase [Xylocopilactobacillus apicola]|uniref:Alpha-acetolactate decarboxylase n=1 Tax=Xylocopilactobacillus apicola TaxID=2932184 RepID=A0AAU9DI51_9LACO|nr:acetolactate decarboxylase [Xylocopilactobacillus apicola]BDR58021.1 alpha-acetolactate decarboxylase [Xylocopilactobacillus apicola]